MTELREGKVRKGGRNKAPTAEMLANRPKPPAAMSTKQIFEAQGFRSDGPSFESNGPVSAPRLSPLPYPALPRKKTDKKYMMPEGCYLSDRGDGQLQLILPTGQALDWYCTEEFGQEIHLRAEDAKQKALQECFPISMKGPNVSVRLGGDWWMLWDEVEGVIFMNKNISTSFGFGTRYARQFFDIMANIVVKTCWLDIGTLKAGKKAVLRFDDLVEQRWVGYVDCWGVCQSPRDVAGKKPDAWAELPAEVR